MIGTLMLALLFAVLVVGFLLASIEYARVEKEIHWPFAGGCLLSLVLLFLFL
jgi:hypothetical protein